MAISEIASRIGSSDAFTKAAAQAGMDPAQAQAALHGVLEHVTTLGSAEGMIESVAAKSGVDPSKIEAFLASMPGLLQGHADTAPEGVQRMLGDIIGSLKTAASDGLASGAGKGGSVAGEAMELVKGLFGRKNA